MRSLSTALLLLALPSVGDVAGPYDHETVEIAPGVIGFFETKLNPIVSGNIVAVIGTKSVLVFDTGHHPPVTRSIIAEIRARTDKPVRYVVVSHWHDDHFVGNAEFATAYPGVEIIAHPFTAAFMEARKPAISGTPCKDELIKDGQPLRDQLAAGKRPDGTPIPEASMTRLRSFVEAVDEQIRQCDEIRFASATRTVTDKLALDLGGKTVELSFLGRANTAGDLVAWLPETKTVLTGDIVVFPFPFATASYITEWARVLHRIDAMKPALIVPGHGPVQNDRRYLSDLTAVLESIARQGRAAYRPGMTVDQLRGRIDLKDHSERFSHGDPFIRANFDFMMMQPGVDRMWQELSGEWKPEQP